LNLIQQPPHPAWVPSPPRGEIGLELEVEFKKAAAPGQGALMIAGKLKLNLIKKPPAPGQGALIIAASG